MWIDAGCHISGLLGLNSDWRLRCGWPAGLVVLPTLATKLRCYLVGQVGKVGTVDPVFARAAVRGIACWTRHSSQ